VLARFYRSVRLFGVWGPIRKASGLTAEERSDSRESLPLAAVNVVLASAVILGVYLGPMYLVGHWHQAAGICLAVAMVAGAALYFTWYRNLPPAEVGNEPAGARARDVG
jgi:multisubunit Na+/H+ antiporter MnhB subunit